VPNIGYDRQVVECSELEPMECRVLIRRSSVRGHRATQCFLGGFSARPPIAVAEKDGGTIDDLGDDKILAVINHDQNLPADQRYRACHDALKHLRIAVPTV
jgi:hypothetical protein